MNEIFTATVLKNKYDKYTVSVLHNTYIEVLPIEINTKNRKLPAKFKVIKDLPTSEEYKKLKEEKYTVTISELVGDIFCQIESLAGEMREWYESIPDNLKETDKANTIDETANNLEGIQSADVPEIASTLKIIYLSQICSNSRSDRCSEIVNMINSAVTALNTYAADCQDEELKEELDGLCI